MHMYDARKTCPKNRAITHILRDEMRFATETSLDLQSHPTGFWHACLRERPRPVVDGGRENSKTAPRGSFAVSGISPPLAAMIDRQVAKPMPMPSGLVV